MIVVRSEVDFSGRVRSRREEINRLRRRAERYVKCRRRENKILARRRNCVISVRNIGETVIAVIVGLRRPRRRAGQRDGYAGQREGRSVDAALNLALNR